MSASLFSLTAWLLVCLFVYILFVCLPIHSFIYCFFCLTGSFWMLVSIRFICLSVYNTGESLLSAQILLAHTHRLSLSICSNNISKHWIDMLLFIGCCCQTDIWSFLLFSYFPHFELYSKHSHTHTHTHAIVYNIHSLFYAYKSLSITKYNHTHYYYARCCLKRHRHRHRHQQYSRHHKHVRISSSFSSFFHCVQ